MTRKCLFLLLAGSLALSGCAASIAASAVGAAIQASRPPETTEDLRQTGIASCSARAAGLGEVRIIDSQQRPGGRVIVWGTVQGEKGRQAFECRWRGEIRDFDLRVLPQSAPVEAPGEEA